MKKNPFLDWIQGAFTALQQKRVLDSYALQSREEQKLRLQTIMALSVELVKIREVSRFSTALGENVIEEIIRGDWKCAASYVEIFTFNDEDQETKERFAPLWKRFRDILHEAVVEARHRETLDLRNPDILPS